MLSVGTKVRIKSRKWYDDLKDSNGNISTLKVHFGFNLNMSVHCGKTAVIIRAYYNNYKKCNDYSLDLDKEGWHWSEDMFEKKLRGIEIE